MDGTDAFTRSWFRQFSSSRSFKTPVTSTMRVKDLGLSKCVYMQHYKTVVCINCGVDHNVCEQTGMKLGGEKIKRVVLYAKKK